MPKLFRTPTTLQYRLTFDTGDYEWKACMRKGLDNKTKAEPIYPTFSLLLLNIDLLLKFPP
jgi:hypothetical protein